MTLSNGEIAYTATGSSTNWCIAGGFAACPGLAGDCDVWVLGVEQEYPARKAILVRLEKFHIPHTREENNPLDQSFYFLGSGDAAPRILCWKVAKLADGRQIILTSAVNAQELLENFDISTHQCALTSEGEFVKGEGWTSITEPPVMLKQTPNTPARMRKITDRYAQFVNQ